jgi:hypothetical protein
MQLVYLLGLLFEDVSSTLLRNTREIISDLTTSHPRRQKFSYVYRCLVDMQTQRIYVISLSLVFRS